MMFRKMVYRTTFLTGHECNPSPPPALQLVSEGGLDAAQEAPFVYGALEQLAGRARRWAEHRAELLAARGLLAAREGGAAEPAALGAAAEAAVKKVGAAGHSGHACVRVCM